MIVDLIIVICGVCATIAQENLPHGRPVGNGSPSIIWLREKQIREITKGWGPS